MECAVPGGLLALIITWELTRPTTPRENLLPRIVTCVAFLLLMAYLVVRVRRRAARELGEVRAVARAAQETLIRPLPSQLDGLALAARQLSVSRGADVGGDLYEALATPYGVRVVIGDVRGHGLPVISTVAAVLGSFREAAHDESGLDGVLRRLDRAHQRHVRDQARDSGGGGGTGAGGGAGGGIDGLEQECLSAEEFVTVLLLEIGPDAEVQVLNCGHPWPYLLGRCVTRLAAGEPLPPLGAAPLPADLPAQRCGRLLPGEAILLHTDGAEDARDPEGRFFRLPEELARILPSGGHQPLPPAALVRRIHLALLRHTAGQIRDDTALLVLRNDRVPVEEHERVPAQSGEPARGPTHGPDLAPAHGPDPGPAHGPDLAPTHGPELGSTHGPDHESARGPAHGPTRQAGLLLPLDE
ncbi:serine/threonine-protein phosphatase [Streptomyces paludis]|uniref:Serine/threonine-protein phosphatase n=2 Tax=Streptomyces paludis TaxID=2282738 RepID=A0A345I065_9ACTN|nr:serine/threonine-protein phosphatase [Streptomyces paludis]